jgi:ATP-dependent DNA helicase DinG
MTFNYDEFFPYSSIREEQRIAIEFSLNALFNENKRFVILSLGTGVGKSGVGVTLGRYIDSHLMTGYEKFGPGAYYVTTQKILQDQYVNDFAPNMKSIKSSSNYECNYYKKQSCEESLKQIKVEPKDSKFYKACSGGCKYRKEKEVFLHSKEGVTNFPYFMTESTYSGKILPRKTLIIDEAHNAEAELSKFIEISVSEYFSEKVLKLPMGELSTQHQVIQWIKNVYIQKLTSHLEHIEKILEKYDRVQDKISEMFTIQKQIDMMKGHKSKIEIFLNVYDPENWVMNEVPGDGKSMRKFEFKAIDVSPFSQGYLFRLGEKVIFMSATILSKETFCETLGIPIEEAAYISIPSPFPIENRPIIFAPVGKMNKDNIDASLPRLVEAVQAILDAHPDEKGIIHAHTYAIAQYIKKNIKSKRLLTHDSYNREEVLRKHMNGNKPTVLLSPSMSEGVDLKGDASRFQIICKIPYPYLGDKLCKKRMFKWKWWYGAQTAKTIIQAVGRSIRSMDDHAVTYILDSDWQTFYSKSKDLFPEEFRAAIKE